MHTTTQYDALRKEQLELYQSLKKSNVKRINNNYTLWQKIYYICSNLPDVPDKYYRDQQTSQSDNYYDKQQSQSNKNKEFIKDEDNCKSFTPINFLFKLKNIIELKLNGEELERGLYYGDKLYLKTCVKLSDIKISQKLKTPTLIKTNDNKLYVYGKNSEGEAKYSHIHISEKALIELKGLIKKEYKYIHETNMSVEVWGELWKQIGDSHVPYKQDHNSGRLYISISSQDQIKKFINKLSDGTIDIGSQNELGQGNLHLMIKTIKLNQDEYKRHNFTKFLDAILRVKSIQDDSLDLFDQKDITNRTLLKEAFKQITMCGGFVAYTMEELYCWRKHLDDVTRQLTKIMGGEGEPNRNIWKDVLRKHKKSNYLETYDQIIATLDKMKLQIEYAIHLNVKKHKENLTDRYPVIITLLKKLYTDKVLAEEQFKQIFENAKKNLNKELNNCSQSKSNKLKDLNKKAPQLRKQIAMMEIMLAPKEPGVAPKKSDVDSWEKFKTDLIKVFTGEKSNETERKKMCDYIDSSSKKYSRKMEKLTREINYLNEKINGCNKEWRECDQNLKRDIKKLREMELEREEKCARQGKQQLLSYSNSNDEVASKEEEQKLKDIDKTKKRMNELKQQINVSEMQLLAIQKDIQKLQEKESYYHTFKAWLTSPYSNEKLKNIKPEDQCYGVSVYNDFLSVLKPGSQSQFGEVTWRDLLFCKCKNGSKTESYLDKISRQKGKVEDMIKLLKPVVENCYTVDSLRDCFAFFIRYFIEYNRNWIYGRGFLDDFLGRGRTKSLEKFLQVFDSKIDKKHIVQEHKGALLKGDKIQLTYKKKYKKADIHELLSALLEAAQGCKKTIGGSYYALPTRVISIITIFQKQLYKLMTKKSDRMKQLLINMKKRTKRLRLISKELNQRMKKLVMLENKEIKALGKLNNIQEDVENVENKCAKNNKHVKQILNKFSRFDKKISNQQRHVIELNKFFKKKNKTVLKLHKGMEELEQKCKEREKQVSDITLEVQKYLHKRIDDLCEKIDENKKKLEQFQQDNQKQVNLASLKEEYDELLSRKKKIEKKNDTLSKQREDIKGKIKKLQKSSLNSNDRLQEIDKEIKDLYDEDEKINQDIECLKKEDEQLQNDTEKLLGKVEKRQIIETSIKIEALQKELQVVQNLCEQVKDFCDDNIKEDVKARLNELKQDLRWLKDTKKEQKELVKNAKNNVKKFKGYFKKLKRKINIIDHNNDYIKKGIYKVEKSLEQLNKQLEEYKSKKQKLIEDMTKNGEEIEFLATKLNADVKVAQRLNGKGIGFDLHDIKDKDRNKVLAVLHVIKNYLSLSSGRKSPYFKKSARMKAKNLSIRLKKYMEDYSDPAKRQSAWGHVEKEMNRHRNSISRFFAKIFKIKTKSQKKYEGKLRILNNSYKKQNVNDIYEQNKKFLTTFVKQEVFSGVDIINQYIKGIDGLILRIGNVKKVINILSKDVDNYLTFVNGQGSVIKSFTEPKTFMESLGKAFEKLCDTFNLKVSGKLGEGIEKTLRTEEVKKRKEAMEKHCGNKQQAVEYAKKWLVDIKKFLEGQENKLNSYEKKLGQVKKDSQIFSSKSLKLQNKLNNMIVVYRERMDRTERIFFLACNLYKGQLGTTSDFMKKVGKINHEHHKKLEEGLHESAKQLPKFGINAYPKEQLKELKDLLKKQKKEKAKRQFKKRELNISGFGAYPSMSQMSQENRRRRVFTKL